MARETITSQVYLLRIESFGGSHLDSLNQDLSFDIAKSNRNTGRDFFMRVSQVKVRSLIRWLVQVIQIQ
jgi:hypothetical protein